MLRLLSGQSLMAVVGRSIRLGARRCWRTIGLGLVLGLMATSSLAAADFDPAFDANVLRFGTARAVQVQSDGKVIVGGWFSHTHGMVNAGNLARFNADGTLDTAFRTATGAGANDWIYAAAIQTDGKILIAGQFTTFNGVARNRLARLNADGSLDLTFDPGAGPNSAVLALAVQTDGKIIAGGAFTSVSGTARNRVARFNANGTHDTGFNPGTGANDNVWDIALQPDGKPVIVGTFTAFNGTARGRIARLTTAGGLDGTITFGTNGTGANNDIYGVEVDDTGRFLIAGGFTSYNGTTRNRIARLLTTGLLDTTFATGTAFGSYSGIYAIGLKLDSAGRVLVAGQFSSYDDYSGVNYTGLPGIIRLSATGARDTGFNPADSHRNMDGQAPQTVAVVAGDAVLVGGDFADTSIGRGGLTRLTATGTRDAAFDIGSGLLEEPSVEVSAGAGGKFYLFGLFDWAGGAMRANVARFLSNGRLDANFALQGYFGEAYFDNTVHELVELPDGDLWVFGSFTRYSGLTRAGALRFSSSGAVEFDSLANELKVQGGYVRRAVTDSNGNLVLAGTFTMISDVAARGGEGAGPGGVELHARGRLGGRPQGEIGFVPPELGIGLNAFAGEEAPVGEGIGGHDRLGLLHQFQHQFVVLGVFGEFEGVLEEAAVVCGMGQAGAVGLQGPGQVAGGGEKLGDHQPGRNVARFQPQAVVQHHEGGRILLFSQLIEAIIDEGLAAQAAQLGPAGGQDQVGVADTVVRIAAKNIGDHPGADEVEGDGAAGAPEQNAAHAENDPELARVALGMDADQAQEPVGAETFLGAPDKTNAREALDPTGRNGDGVVHDSREQEADAWEERITGRRGNKLRQCCRSVQPHLCDWHRSARSQQCVLSSCSGYPPSSVPVRFG